MEKKIVVILRKPPHGTLYPAEGLRVAVALSVSEPKVISIGDSVYAFLQEVDMSLYKHHIDFLSEIEIPILIDKDSLEERGLIKGDLVDGVTVKERKQILSTIATADATLTF
jgi:sulfur relay (sulfurtransferase) DsrF/TusC family protein